MRILITTTDGVQLDLDGIEEVGQAAKGFADGLIDGAIGTYRPKLVAKLGEWRDAIDKLERELVRMP